MKEWLRSNKLTLTFVLLGAIIFLFIVVPLFRMIFASDPGILRETLLDPEVTKAILLTLWAALIATGVGFPPRRLDRRLTQLPQKRLQILSNFW